MAQGLGHIFSSDHHSGAAQLGQNLSQAARQVGQVIIARAGQAREKQGGGGVLLPPGPKLCNPLRQTAGGQILLLVCESEDRQILQREPDVPGEHGAAGELGAVASCSDDGGPDGFLPQNVVPLAQGAAPDGPAQEHADVPVGKGIGRRLPDQIRHTAGKGQGDLPRREGDLPIGQEAGGNLSLPQASRHLQSLDQALYSRGQVRFRHPLARSQMA